jgi:hypothetical protein
MRAKWRDPLRACMLDLQQAPAAGLTRHGGDLDGLAGERIRHVGRLPPDDGDAVATMSDMIDDETFNHGARR